MKRSELKKWSEYVIGIFI